MSSSTIDRKAPPKNKRLQRTEVTNSVSSRSATLPLRKTPKPTGMGTSASAQHSQEANGQATQPTEWGHARMGIFARLDCDNLPNRDPNRVDLFRRVQLGHANPRDLQLGETDANQPGPYNRRLLHAAAESNRVDLLIHLLGPLGANVDAVDADGWSAVHFAASADAAEAIGELMRRCSRLGNLRNLEGQTPLMTAAIFGAAKAATVLLQLGGVCGDVQAFDTDGDTAAMLAVKCRRASMLRLLLGHKKTAKVQLKQSNGQGKSVVDLVKESGDAEMEAIVKAARK